MPSALPSDTLDHDGRGARALDKFGFFFAFYSLILGLAVTELLSGLAGVIRARAARKIDRQVRLLGLLTFIVICIAWLDAWNAFGTVALDLNHVALPVVVATLYYLAAALVFPTDPKDFDRFDAYYAESKRFVVGLLLASQLFTIINKWEVLTSATNSQAALFWHWLLPYNALAVIAFGALLMLHGRRANYVLLAVLILLFAAGYWEEGGISWRALI